MEMLWIEKIFDVEAVSRWCDETKHISLISSAAYVVFLFFGTRYMKSREAFQLRVPLVFWNVALALFSIVGSIRTVPEFVDALSQHGWKYSICDKSFYFGQTGFWAYVFVFSKLIELGDTVFVVLRKQNLTFLHCFHHTTVLIYSFYSYSYHVSGGRWYTVMNFCIHSIMYSYFALKAMKIYVPRSISAVITSLQIVQMVGGLAVSGNILLIHYSGQVCHQTPINALSAVLMYLSYFVLFIHFFYRSYASPELRKKGRGGCDSVEKKGQGEYNGKAFGKKLE